MRIRTLLTTKQHTGQRCIGKTMAGLMLAMLCLLGLAPAARAATIPVTSTADDGSAGTLRVALASAGNGDTVDATRVSGTITLTMGELVVSNSVTIVGPGPATLAVDGNFPNTTNRVFHITNGVSVAISSLTITHGARPPGFDYPAASGGGIFNDHSILTVSNCTVRGNSAEAFGGGIDNFGEAGGSATLTVVNSTISGNSAPLAGGIYNDGVFGSAALTVSTSTLSGNSANGGGSGIYNDGYSGSATLTVSNCTVTGGAGSGIFNLGVASFAGPGSATLTVVASTVSSNSADVGGGIVNEGGGVSGAVGSGTATATVVNSTVSGNSATNGGGMYNFVLLGLGSATLTVSNSAVTGNSASGGDFGEGGGGIFNDHATLTVVASTVSGNSASGGTFDGGEGGGIFNDGESSGSATLTVVNSTVSSNSANFFGGGIYNDGFGVGGSATLTVSASTISSNSAGDGGGIYSDHSTLTVSTSTISGNSAGFGAGIVNDGGFGGTATLTLSTSTVSGNSAFFAGGGIYNFGTEGDATLAIGTSTLSGNSASSGGGIFNDGEASLESGSGSATLTVVASTISSNSAGAFGGGGIVNFGGSSFPSGSGSASAQIATSTLSGNSATIGGGIYNSLLGPGTATLEIGDTILNAGASGANISNLTGTVTSDGYNLSSDAAGGDGTTGPGGLLHATGDIRNTNPLLGPLQDNGGPTFTHALLAGSPAIDKGFNYSGLTTDQRGLPRPVDDPTIANAPGGDGSDIGAFEVQTTTPNRCPLAQGFWRNNPGSWPVASLRLGSQTYTKTELLTILKTSIGGDASLILADQLITAKLNIASGSNPAPISATIADADSLLSLFTGKLPYKVKTTSATGKAMINDANVLNNYNSGLLTPACTP